MFYECSVDIQKLYRYLFFHYFLTTFLYGTDVNVWWVKHYYCTKGRRDHCCGTMPFWHGSGSDLLFSFIRFQLQFLNNFKKIYISYPGFFWNCMETGWFYLELFILLSFSDSFKTILSNPYLRLYVRNRNQSRNRNLLQDHGSGSGCDCEKN